MTGGRPQSQPSRKKRTESYLSVSDYDTYGLETTLAGAPTEDDSDWKGLSNISAGKDTLIKKGHVSNNTSINSVKKGKQRVPQEGGASTARPSAGTSADDDREFNSLIGLNPAKAVSEDKLEKLFKRAMEKPKHYTWPEEHKDFLKAYMVFVMVPVDVIEWGTMRTRYKDFHDLYGDGPIKSMANKLRPR